MIRPAIVLSILLLASSVFAQPQITSISPSSGPAAGGTTITIRGSGFDTTCPPELLVCATPSVQIGLLPVASFHVVDAQTIEAVTMPSLPGAFEGVTVTFPRGSAHGTFTFTGDVTDAFDRILLPIFTPPVTGSLGSKFITAFSIWKTAGEDTPVFAFQGPPPPCVVTTCIPPIVYQPMLLKARQGSPASEFIFDGDPGRLLYVPKGSFDRIAASLRVADISRSAESAGTRIPIAPERDFRSDFIDLLDIPANDNFRYTLRIYSLDADTSVHVRYIRNDSTAILREDDVTLRNPSDMFHPGYAQVSNIQPMDPLRIEIAPNGPGKHIWAFVSVTNNATQQITIVAPH